MLNKIIQAIPQQPGSYSLWLHLSQPEDLLVGRLGYFTFPVGDYLYLGSAHGPGGMRARLGRHLHGDGKPQWHIDHLRAAAQVRGFGYLTHKNWTDHIPTECTWSQSLASLPEARVPASGFGTSDCRAGCPAHLVYFQALDVDQIAQLLNCEVYLLGDE